MAERITVLFEMIGFFLQGYCLQYFLGSFLEYRISGRRRMSVLVLLCYGAMKAATGQLLFFDSGGSLNGLYRLTLQTILLTALVFCFYRAKKTVTVFLLTAFTALSEICFFIGYLVMSMSTILLELEVRLFMQGYIAEAGFDRLMRGTAASLQILCCILWVLFLYLSLRRVTYYFREKDHEMQRTELLFILTPGLVGLLLCVLLRIIMVTVEDGRPELLYDRYPALQFLIPAILLLALLSIVYSVRLFQDMILLSRERSQRVILEQQIDTLQEHIGEIERLYAGVRSIKHDMKNTLMVLMSLSSKNDADDSPELSAYLSELNQSFDKLEFRFRTGNAAADALLNMKYHEITGRIPDLVFEADGLLFPEDSSIQSYDIGVILGNALDNAMEGCVRLKQQEPKAKTFIRLHSFRRSRYFFLEVENSFDGKISQDRGTGFPTTLKTERQAHGIGFENMKKTAEKYGGTVDYSVEGSPDETKDTPGYAIFTLSVMLRECERREADTAEKAEGKKKK